MLFEMNIESIKRVCLGKLYDFAVNNNYHYNVNDIIHFNNCDLKILDKIRIEYNNGKSSKGYIIECMSCGYIYNVSEVNLDRGDACPLCSNHKIIKGVNDLYSTCPEVALMLKNPEDGYKYTKYSNKEVEFVCPHCNKETGRSYIHNVSRYGLSCQFCGHGTSYPNRLMYNLLSEIGEDFDDEVVFDWCVFPKYMCDNKLSFGRYDFVIANKKLIIEMDGGFGHGKEPHPKSRYSKEELIYRDKMKDLLANNHGYTVIRIDCDYSSHNRLEYISCNILNSLLSNIYPLDTIDWNTINSNCFKKY